MISDKIKCAICGKEMSAINNRHLKTHGLTAEEYKEKYPGHPLLSESAQKKLSDRSIKSNADRKGKKRSEKDIESIRKGIKEKRPSLKGIKKGPMSDAHKKALSESKKKKFASGEIIPTQLGKPHSEETKRKIAETLKGMNHSEETRSKMSRSRMGQPSPMKGKFHSEETKKKIGRSSKSFYEKTRIERRQHMIEKISESNLEIKNSISEQVFFLKCKICDYEFTRSPQFFQPSKWKNTNDLCPQCFPKDIRQSEAENEIHNFIKSLIDVPVIHGDRQVIKPLELDIYIPSVGIAIEYCGLYWHSEKQGKDENYHRFKYDECAKQGIRLFTIFEDEWANKPEIVKSILANALLKNTHKVPARKCSVVKLTTKQSSPFLNENHIQGAGRSKEKYGLVYQDELVSVMTFSKSELSRRQEGWDMNRFASKMGYSVQGAAGKLYKAFRDEHGPDMVKSYADLRYGFGHVYGALGFRFDGLTVPNYWYFRPNEIKKYHRFGLRKRFDESKDITEWELRQAEGWDRIWDCGHARWIWERNQGVS